MPSGGGKDGKADAARAERLAAALRENLKRRKTQARGRAAGPRDASEPSPAAPDDAPAERPPRKP